MTTLEKTNAERPSPPLRRIRDAILKIQGHDAARKSQRLLDESKRK
jgi:hypothetical protein